MAGRALVFSNPRVIEILRQQFIPYAGDMWEFRKDQGPTGEFFRKVVLHGYRGNRPEDMTRQGIYAATADGALLASGNPTAYNDKAGSLERMLALLNTALAARPPLPAAEATGAAVNLAPQGRREPPAKGLVLDAFTRIPFDFEGQRWALAHATGRDHVWLTENEWRSLLPAKWERGTRYPVPQPLVERLVRFHLVDNVRGEPDMWRPSDIQEASLFLTVGDPGNARTGPGRLALQGTVRVSAPADPPGTKTPGGRALRKERGYEARLQGELVYDRKQQRFTRCDMVAWGEAWGQGYLTPGAPPGRFPLLIAFNLAGARPADRIPPQGLKYPGYFGNGSDEEAR